MHSGTSKIGSQPKVKRLIDWSIAIVGLVMLFPLFSMIALLIKLTSKGPLLYKSTRLGRYGRPFVLLKFRSMYMDSTARYNSDGSVQVERNDARLTPVGRFLRIGFDELPQLWNVLKGEMSLIGPRPDLPHAKELYTQEEAVRLLVRPGITGLAQVSGRTDIPWKARLALDVAYVKQYSLQLDARIALLTLLEIIPPLKRFRSKKVFSEVTTVI